MVNWGRKKGFKQSEETKRKISEKVRAAFLRAKLAEKLKEKSQLLGQAEEELV